MFLPRKSCQIRAVVRLLRRWTQPFVAWLLLGLALSGCSGPSAPRTAFGAGLPQVTASPEIREQERAMHARVNRDRAAQGLPALTYDERLADIARFHSADMRDHRFFAHDSPNSGSLQDRLNAAGYLSLAARENLSEAPDIDKGQEGLLNSPGHYANIMADDVTHIGIGIVPGGVHEPGNLTITQVFARPGREESPQQARAAIIDAVQQARRNAGLGLAQQSPLLGELAERHVATLAKDDQQLNHIGDSITEEVSKRREPGQSGVVINAQRLSDSSAFQVPERLLQNAQASFGVAVSPTQDAGGRPLLQVLLLVGI